MFRKHSRRRRGFLSAFPTALALAGYLVIGGAIPAQAATGCVETSGTLTVTIAAASTNATFAIDGSGDVVVTNVTGCSGSYDPTTDTTMEVLVETSGSNETVTFVDAANTDWPATVEVDLGDGTDDRIVLQGTAGDDTFSTSDPVAPRGRRIRHRPRESSDLRGRFFLANPSGARSTVTGP